MRYLALSMLLFSLSALSVTAEDIIYKKDGSVLRGQLIEQNFSDHSYTIKLAKGPVLVVAQQDISNIVNHTNPASTSHLNQTSGYTLKSSPPTKDHQYTVFIGRHFHEITTPEHNIYNYFSSADVSRHQNFHGFRVGLQAAHSRHFATLYALEMGRLNRVTIDDRQHDMMYESPSYEDTRYFGLDASVILSTNLQKGWQFYIGGGVFHNRYLRDSSDFNAYGTQLDFGLGYSWYNCQLLMRVDTDLSNSLNGENADLFNLSFDFGYNF